MTKAAGRLFSPQRAALGLGGLLLAGWLGGCQRPGSEQAADRRPPPSGPLVDGRPLSRTDILLQIARIPHAELTTRLGPHRFDSQTRYTITPQGGPPLPEVAAGFRPDGPPLQVDGGASFENGPVALLESRTIQVDGAGRLALQTSNDHGYGVEAMLDRDVLYLRLRYAPCVRRHPEGDEVERLRALGYESGAALLEAVAPFVYLSTPIETSRSGRPAWQVKFSRQERSGPPPTPERLGKAWRSAVAVDKLDGYAIVDRQRGLLLELQLSTRFSAPRPTGVPGTATSSGEQVVIEAEHQLRLVALGPAVADIAAPTDWIDPPTRPRPTLEKQELLSGLGSGAPHP
jgi:hypothetical protein